MLSVSGWQILSQALGWIYFTSWSFSFYPQIQLNFQRKSSAGFSPDFATTNPIGYLALTIFNSALYFSRHVRDQYAQRHDSKTPTVGFIDVGFAIHALGLSLICFGQTMFYPRTAEQRLSQYNKIVIPLIVLSISTFGVVVWSGLGGLQLLDWLYGFSYIKIYITFSKYVPQAILNYQRKSTIGWSIANIWLDFIGGLLSFVQLILDSWLIDDVVGGVFGNPSKLGMGLFSLSFDILFLVQHFILYPDTEKRILAAENAPIQGEVDERTPLVADQQGSA